MSNSLGPATVNYTPGSSQHAPLSPPLFREPTTPRKLLRPLQYLTFNGPEKLAGRFSPLQLKDYKAGNRKASKAWRPQGWKTAARRGRPQTRWAQPRLETSAESRGEAVWGEVGQDQDHGQRRGAARSEARRCGQMGAGHGGSGSAYPGARRTVSAVGPGAGWRLWRRLRGSPGCGRDPPEAPSRQDKAGGGAGGAARAHGAAGALGRGSAGPAGGRVGTQMSP